MAPHVPTTREDVELVLLREAQERDELLLAQRRMLARRNPLGTLKMLHAEDKGIKFWYIATIDVHLGVEAALQIQARWRTRPMTPASNLLLSQALTAARVKLRRLLHQKNDMRDAIEAEALQVFQRAAPPLANRITVLRRRLADSTYRTGRDKDAGGDLPKDVQHHPVYEMVRTNQAELLATQRTLATIEHFWLVSFGAAAGKRTRNDGLFDQLRDPFGAPGLVMKSLLHLKGPSAAEQEMNTQAAIEDPRASTWKMRQRRRALTETSRAKQEREALAESAAQRADLAVIQTMTDAISKSVKQLHQLARSGKVQKVLPQYQAKANQAKAAASEAAVSRRTSLRRTVEKNEPPGSATAAADGADGQAPRSTPSGGGVRSSPSRRLGGKLAAASTPNLHAPPPPAAPTPMQFVYSPLAGWVPQHAERLPVNGQPGNSASRLQAQEWRSPWPGGSQARSQGRGSADRSDEGALPGVAARPLSRGGGQAQHEPAGGGQERPASRSPEARRGRKAAASGARHPSKQARADASAVARELQQQPHAAYKEGGKRMPYARHVLLYPYCAQRQRDEPRHVVLRDALRGSAEARGAEGSGAEEQTRKLHGTRSLPGLVLPGRPTLSPLSPPTRVASSPRAAPATAWGSTADLHRPATSHATSQAAPPPAAAAASAVAPSAPPPAAAAEPAREAAAEDAAAEVAVAAEEAAAAEGVAKAEAPTATAEARECVAATEPTAEPAAAPAAAPGAPPGGESAAALPVEAAPKPQGAQAVLVFGVSAPDVSASLAAASGGTAIGLQTLMDAAEAERSEEGDRLLEVERTGGIVPFSTALPMLLRLLASSPPPYVLNAYPRMARHVRQLEASTGQLALAVQAGEPGEPGTPRGSGADAALVAAFRQAGTAVHACASSAEADVGLARDAMAAAGIALRCSD